MADSFEKLQSQPDEILLKFEPTGLSMCQESVYEVKTKPQSIKGINGKVDTLN